MKADLLVALAFAVAGIVMIMWANSFSLRYNAWTTRLRERNPNFNPPPTPEWRVRNTKIMTVLFRVVGIVFIFRGLITILPILTASQHH
jgi:hypothetical protein